MDNNIQKFYIDFGINNVSRETCVYLENFIDLVIKENKVLNLISRENENKEYIRKRHIIDSMQIIDFIDLNTKNNRFWIWIRFSINSFSHIYEKLFK